jgi:hypothetical protein
MSGFIYDAQSIASLKDAFSVPRLSTHKRLVGNDAEDDVFILYLLNSRLSGAFVNPINVVEVVLRNKCDRAVTRIFGSDWMTNGRLNLTDWQKESIRMIIARRHAVSAADFTMGFWVELLSKKFDVSLWRTTLHKEFRPASGRSMQRKDVHSVFNGIRDFRNRVAHHQQVVGWDPLRCLEKMIESVGWLSPEASSWLASHEEVSGLCREIEEEKVRRGWSGF